MKILLLALFVAASRAANCDFKELDKCAKPLTFYADGAKMSEDAKSLETACKNERPNMACVKKFVNDCLTGIAKGTVQILVEGVETQISNRCNVTHPGHQEFLQKVKCINQVNDGLQKCMVTGSGALEVSMAGPKKERVGRSCCYIPTYESCVMDVLRTKCDESHVTYAKSIMKIILGDLMDSICAGFRPGSDKCAKFPAIVPAANPKYVSLLVPLAEGLQSLTA